MELVFDLSLCLDSIETVHVRPEDDAAGVQRHEEGGLPFHVFSDDVE
jgi:hypothetical protein